MSACDNALSPICGEAVRDTKNFGVPPAGRSRLFFVLYDIAILLGIAGALGSVVGNEITPASPSKFPISVRVCG